MVQMIGLQVPLHAEQFSARCNLGLLFDLLPCLMCNIQKGDVSTHCLKQICVTTVEAGTFKGNQVSPTAGSNRCISSGFLGTVAIVHTPEGQLY